MSANTHQSPVIFLMGPTASGKTAAALEIAKQAPVEIISVDSALVYRGMDIGTAKPSVEELAAVPHHLIDICDPSEAYSAGDFCRDVNRLIPEIVQRGKIPLLAGGTMLYYRSLTQLDKLPSSKPELREKLQRDLDEFGVDVMHQRLASLDAAAAENLNVNDKQRILRALELLTISPGKTLQQIYAESAKADFPYPVLKLALMPERAVLHQRIEQRLQQMFANGFLQEVETLYARGDLHADMPAIRAVGYRQVWEYLSGEIDYQTAQNKALYATRQLAKRQCTWLKKEQEALIFDSQTYEMKGIVEIVKKFLA